MYTWWDDKRLIVSCLSSNFHVMNQPPSQFFLLEKEEHIYFCSLFLSLESIIVSWICFSVILKMVVSELIETAGECLVYTPACFFLNRVRLLICILHFTTSHDLFFLLKFFTTRQGAFLLMALLAYLHTENKQFGYQRNPLKHLHFSCNREKKNILPIMDPKEITVLIYLSSLQNTLSNPWPCPHHWPPVIWHTERC